MASGPGGDARDGVASRATAAAGGVRPLALVTGARRGIGLAIARAFARSGHDVAIADLAIADLAVADLGSADPGSADPESSGEGAAPARSRKSDVRVESLVADVGDEAAVEGLFEETAARFGRVPDILVNNAAVQFWSPLLELSVADWERTLQVNLTGPFLTTRRFARARIEAARARAPDGEAAAAVPGGVIVNIGSGCNRLAFGSLVSYTASKGGLEMLTKVSALELGPLGIRVNCVAPGAIETERTRAETTGYARAWAPLTPLRRVGQVDDVAEAVLALCGESMRFVSGETLAVDGGLFARAPWPHEY